MKRGGRKQKRIYKVNINPLKIKVMHVITGKVLALTDKVEGQNERGDWARRSIIVEYGDEYPRKVCITAGNAERIATIESLELGKYYAFGVVFESREVNGNWFTDIRFVRLA